MMRVCAVVFHLPLRKALEDLCELQLVEQTHLNKTCISDNAVYF